MKRSLTSLPFRRKPFWLLDLEADIRQARFMVENLTQYRDHPERWEEGHLPDPALLEGWQKHLSDLERDFELRVHHGQLSLF